MLNYLTRGVPRVIS